MKAIIFIPGYKGSELTKKNQRDPVWMTAGQSIWGKTSLAFDISHLPITDANGLISTKILDKINIAPRLSKDIYASWLDSLNQSFHAQADIFLFHYDWRREILDHVQKLDLFVTELINRGYSEINVIAHSLGGLIISYYLRYGIQSPESASENWHGAKAIQKVVFAGVPFKGTLIALKDIYFGEQIVLNKTILNKNAVQTFPIAYQLLPRLDTPSLVSIAEFMKPLSLYDLNTWKKYRLGLFEDDTDLHIKQRFLEKYLERGEKIFQLIHLPSPQVPRTLKCLTIRSKAYPTYNTFYLATDQSKYRLLTRAHQLRPLIRPDQNRLFAEGDGTILFESAALPHCFQENAKELFAKKTHQNLFNDDAIRAAIVDFFK